MADVVDFITEWVGDGKRWGKERLVREDGGGAVEGTVNSQWLPRVLINISGDKVKRIEFMFRFPLIILIVSPPHFPPLLLLLLHAIPHASS